MEKQRLKSLMQIVTERYRGKISEIPCEYIQQDVAAHRIKKFLKDNASMMSECDKVLVSPELYTKKHIVKCLVKTLKKHEEHPLVYVKFIDIFEFVPDLSGSSKNHYSKLILDLYTTFLMGFRKNDLLNYIYENQELIWM